VRILLLLLIFHWQNSFANDVEALPQKFEWGAGFLSLYGNHYRGSDQAKFWFFPMPYFTYSSKLIEAEPSFVRGIFFRSDWFTFKLSLMLGPNAESKNNRARSGMPSLDYTIELGPMFIFHLWSTEDKIMRLNFEVPMRGIFATDLSYIRHVGLFTVPYLSLKHSNTIQSWNWSSEVTLSPMYADANYHDYFYGVSQQYARADRALYKAHGGYSGFQTALVFNKRFENVVVIPFIRWDYLDRAVFEDSPLVKTKNYIISGLGLFWLFD
jgi:outer membrane scaffolding protein for murein synthesis (MipA/OmpV family)